MEIFSITLVSRVILRAPKEESTASVALKIRAQNLRRCLSPGRVPFLPS